MIVFAWRRLTPPGFIGGAELAEGRCAALLASLGHDVRFIGSAEDPRHRDPPASGWLIRMLTHEKIPYEITSSRVSYRWRGVHCLCIPQAEMKDSVRGSLRDSARLLWTSLEGCGEFAAQAKELKVSVATFMHSVSEAGMQSTEICARFRFAPSQFVQRTAHIRAGVQCHLLRPMIETSVSQSDTRSGRNVVLFVNPIPEKGLDVALALAEALPTREFVFVESWREVRRKSFFPPNVTVISRQPSLNNLYARTRLLVVPSIIQDAAPMVITEAGRLAIPVIGSTAGGIPELVADPLHNCINTDDRAKWIARAELLTQDDTAWRLASKVQSVHSRALAQNSRLVIIRAGLLDETL